MALKPCKECGQEVSTKAKKCPNCGTPRPTRTLSKGATGCLGFIGIVVVIGVISSMFGGGDYTPTPEQEDTPANRVERPQAEQVSARQLDPAAVQQCIAEAPRGPSPLARRIDEAFMGMPMNLTDEEAFQLLAERFGVPSDTVEAIITRGTQALSGRGTEEVQRAVECITRQFGKIHTVVVSGLNFANVSYIDTTFTALNAEHVRDQVLASMPSRLNAYFLVPSLERVRLTARYPATDDQGRDAGSLRVALVEVRREEFQLTRDVRTYSSFTVYGESNRR